MVGADFEAGQQAVLAVRGGLGCSSGGGGGEGVAWGGEKTEIPTERALALTTSAWAFSSSASEL